MSQPFIVKASGIREPFDPTKLETSLRHAGAPEDVIESIVTTVTAEVRDGMETRDIYRRAFSLLRKNKTHKPVALKYSLRRAIAEMGPNGHPFEELVGELLRRKEYTVRVAVTVQGWCVEHEVDVCAQKGPKHILIECKFHNNHGIRSDVKTALYVQARFEDVKKKQRADEASDKFHEVWLVSNTKFTETAIAYAECIGMQLLSWSYPKGAGLRDLMDEVGVYPITVLPALSVTQKRILMDNNIVTCTQLVNNELFALDIGVTPKKWKQVLNEISLLCGKKQNNKQLKPTEILSV